MDKVIIVEGKTDRDQLLEVLNEPVEILCSNGTLSLNYSQLFTQSSLNGDN